MLGPFSLSHWGCGITLPCRPDTSRYHTGTLQQIMTSTQEASLKDYGSEESLKQYMKYVNDPNDPAINTRYYTLYSLLPSLKDKIVLDLPCGLGHKARKFILEYGAAKVVASDIVEKQLTLSKEFDISAGIQSGQIEYVHHDAKIPKVIASSLADICVSVHLFCFAENFAELVEISRFIFVNLKPGCTLYATLCSLRKGENVPIEKSLTEFGCCDVQVGPWLGDVHKPRLYKCKFYDFQYDVFAWEYEAVCEALQQAGFSNIELHPFKADPNYKGAYDLQEYITLFNGNILTAMKPLN